MSRQRFEVQRQRDAVYVVRQSGAPPRPGPGEVVLQMVACGICGADIRAMTGNKEISSEVGRYTTPGHEGVGRVIARGSEAAAWRIGDYAVVLPHVHRAQFACQASRINPVCIGSGHTLHMGWDIDGCFAEWMVVPATNVVHIAQRDRHRAARQAPALREAIFALVEPMLCTLSAYELIETHLQRDLPPGRALVIGCGPIGVLHSLLLLARGFEVWLTDPVQKRAELARWCLGERARVFHPHTQQPTFDLAMVTASSAAAIETGETCVRKGGIVYLFAGLNTAEIKTMGNHGLFLYETVHRKAYNLSTTLRLAHEERSVLYLGHSGYYEHLAPQAIAAVAAHAAALNRAVTGVIPGFPSPRVISRLPGGVDWSNEELTPAIVAILQGADLLARHCKLLVLPGAEDLA